MQYASQAGTFRTRAHYFERLPETYTPPVDALFGVLWVFYLLLLPAVVAAIGWLLIGERRGPRYWLALAIMVIGAVGFVAGAITLVQLLFLA